MPLIEQLDGRNVCDHKESMPRQFPGMLQVIIAGIRYEVGVLIVDGPRVAQARVNDDNNLQWSICT